jgi:hypothetical protein
MEIVTVAGDDRSPLSTDIGFKLWIVSGLQQTWFPFEGAQGARHDSGRFQFEAQTILVNVWRLKKMGARVGVRMMKRNREATSLA